VRDIGVVGPFAPSGFAAFIHAIDPKGQLGFSMMLSRTRRLHLCFRGKRICARPLKI
jgi:hypothetical protein